MLNKVINGLLSHASIYEEDSSSSWRRKSLTWSSVTVSTSGTSGVAEFWVQEVDAIVLVMQIVPELLFDATQLGDKFFFEKPNQLIWGT